eukprot:CAMPEP_0118884142 /NCGR_PEP_ID=MMETSP1163-20130328/23065_1 /TAXON_ID=124430 /ORGANISM="Phaeomonas parva, Strain CCMP2877" /LENGTH=112 /DNA_ID=CAMNT_0006821823 /DNA_START=1094 /DNA_END=1429 /DNA_ORIENTATION=+
MWTSSSNPKKTRTRTRTRNNPRLAARREEASEWLSLDSIAYTRAAAVQNKALSLTLRLLPEQEPPVPGGGGEQARQEEAEVGARRELGVRVEARALPQRAGGPGRGLRARLR